MELIPSIDLLGGKVVRLLRGRFEDVTVYSDDPVAEARRFADAGVGESIARRSAVPCPASCSTT